MSKQVGLIKVKGSLDGVSFYQKGGENFVRMSKGPSKTMIEKSPKFKEFRENRSEFIGSMKVVKALRQGLEKSEKTMFDGSYSVRSGKVFRTIISRHAGARGKRPMEIVKQKDVLEGFELNINLPVKEVLTAPFSFSASADRKTITLTVPDFNIDKVVVAPEKATHFKLINLAGVLASYIFNVEEKGYVPLDKLNDTKNGVAMSDFLPITGNSGALSIVSTLSTVAALDPTSAVFAAIGIQFYQNRDTNYYAIGQNGVMKIAQLF